MEAVFLRGILEGRKLRMDFDKFCMIWKCGWDEIGRLPSILGFTT